AAGIMMNHPWDGVGFDQSSHYYKAGLARDVLNLRERIGLPSIYFTLRYSLDNQLFNSGAELGIPGMAACTLLITGFSGFMLYGLWVYWRKRENDPLVLTALCWGALMP